MPFVVPLAHGLVQRADLPLPEWLFGWAAGIVLVVSFVGLALLWPRPKLEQPRWRPVQGPLGALPCSPSVRSACGAFGVFLLMVTLASGFAGSNEPQENFAPTFVYVVFWVGLVFLSIVFGDVFRAFNPWLALGRSFERLAGRRHVPRPYPERLGRWPAVLGLVAFAWLELCSKTGELPRNVAVATSIYTVAMLAGSWRYGAETWTDRGDAFSVYFNILSRVSAFEVRDGRLGVRPLLSGLTRWNAELHGSVALVAVMIGTTTFDGFSSGSLWTTWRNELETWFYDLGASLVNAERLASTVGLFGSIAVIGGFYALGIAGASRVGGPDAARLRSFFLHSLAPISVVYVLAHYLTFLIFQGQAMKYLISDPLGKGWDLFGTAGSAIDYGLLGQNATWYLQVLFIVLGHVAALILAHDRALTVYDDSRLAVRSQYWMLAIMVGFTTLALWLLASAGAS